MAVVASFSWPTTAVYIGTPVDVALLYGVDRLPAVQGYRTFREVIPRYTRVRVRMLERCDRARWLLSPSDCVDLWV